jgi:hypothetical protein
MAARTKTCIDCDPDIKKPRPAPHPGPRCVTHHRAVTKTRKANRHDKRVRDIYGLRPGEYKLLYEAQGGRCAICGIGRGISKKLAVDHDHKTGIARGLCCARCNEYIGVVRDDPEAFRRGFLYLLDPPALRILGPRIHQDNRDDNDTDMTGAA